MSANGCDVTDEKKDPQPVSPTTPDQARRRTDPSEASGPPRRGRSAARRLALMVTATTTTFVILGALFVIQTMNHALAIARTDAKFQAQLAARSIDDALTLGLTSLAGTAQALPVKQLLAKPSQCHLLFTGLGPFPRGHLDIVLNDGKVICSSLARHGAPPGATHAGAPWLRRAQPAGSPTIWPTSLDRLSGAQALAVTTTLTGRTASRPPCW